MGAEAQSNPYLGKTFSLIQNYAAAKCQPDGSPLPPAQAGSTFLLSGFLFKVVAASSNGYVITIIPWKVPQRFEAGEVTDINKVARFSRNERNNLGYVVDDSKNQIYYLIPTNLFTTVAVQSNSYWKFSIGTPTIPMKLRFGNGKSADSSATYFRFEGSLSLGLEFGAKYLIKGSSDYAFNILGGFTIASVPIDSLTTKNNSQTTTASAFSPNLCFVAEIKGFQFGVFGGFDFLVGKLNKEWLYRNQPWFGIGIGYSLFKTANPQNTNSATATPPASF